MSGFGDKLRRDRAIVLDVRFPEGDTQVWFILEVATGKFDALKRALDTPLAPLDLRDYGSILHSGYGAPDDTLKASLREQYGMYED